MRICFFTYNYKPDDVTALANIFAFGVKKRVLGDEVDIIDATNLAVDLHEHMKYADIVAIAGTWGSTHQSRKGNDAKSIMNKVNQEVVCTAKQQNKPVLVFESPTLSRVRSSVQTVKEIHPRYYRVSLDHWLYGIGEFFDNNFDYKRFQNFSTLNKILKTKTEVQWPARDKNAHILVLPEKETAPICHGIDQRSWLELTIKQLKNTSARTVIIKQHPDDLADYLDLQSDTVQVVDKNSLMSDLLRNAWATVILDSTSCFESIWHGVPVFCYPGTFASSLGNTNITNIEQPVKPPLLPWWQKMAYTEFTQQEIQQGEMWVHIRPYIENKLSRMKK